MSEAASEGRLIVVGTPIGNLSDITPRAIEVLASADVILCEDTRRTRALLSALAVPTRPSHLVSLHAHNESERAERIVGWLKEGRTVALVSDAGMPLISDPGENTVRSAIEAGATVDVVPGPSSVLAALVVSGLPSDRFCVEGFLPRKGSARRRALSALGHEVRTSVLFEAPTRLVATLTDLSDGLGPRPVCVARELTKLHQEIWRGTLAEAVSAFSDRSVRGEIVLVLGGAPPDPPPSAEAVASAVAAQLALGHGARESATEVAMGLGVSRRVAYECAIGLLKDNGTPAEGA
jgi:16S rRNA (cytidine1402-2'-O)-methyltransferase